MKTSTPRRLEDEDPVLRRLEDEDLHAKKA